MITQTLLGLLTLNKPLVLSKDFGVRLFHANVVLVCEVLDDVSETYDGLLLQRKRGIFVSKCILFFTSKRGSLKKDYFAQFA